MRLVFINIYALEGYFKQKVSIFLLTFTELIIALNNSVFKYACQGELRLYIFFWEFLTKRPNVTRIAFFEVIGTLGSESWYLQRHGIAGNRANIKEREQTEMIHVDPFQITRK